MEKNLNLTITGMYDKTAVITHNYKQRAAIEEVMRANYPKLMEAWRPGELAGHEDYEVYESCIALHIYDNECYCVQVADEAYWRGEGYTLLEFDSLLESPVDFGEFSNADSDINCLFV